MTFSAAGVTALNQQIINEHWMAFLDIDGEPQRVTTAPYPLSFASTGDDDLDGATYGRTSAIVSVGPVTHQRGGSESVSVILSGLPGVDTDVLVALGDRTKYQGRLARLWAVILDPVTDELVSISHYYTGRMMSIRLAGTADSATILMEIEGYMASHSGPSNSTYLNQAEFDPGDVSANLTLAVANGTSAIGAVGYNAPKVTYDYGGWNFGGWMF